MATRSGTNQIHGSAFEFLRNSDLDARNFFDQTLGPPPFKRNQFGGSVGGPLSKDRLFYFGNYEGLRQNLGLTVVQTVPDDNARKGLLPTGPGGSLVQVPVNPAVAPFMVIFPPANGRNFRDGTAQAILNPSQVSTQNFYLGRVDYRLSDKDSFFARYNYEMANQHTNSPILIYASTFNTHYHILTLEETRTYAATLNTMRFGFTRPVNVVDNGPTVPQPPGLVFLPGAPVIGAIQFASGGGVGAVNDQGTTNPGRHFALNQFEVGDQVFHQRGAHALQMGVQVQRFQSNGDFGDAKAGQFQFAGFPNFLAGIPLRFQGPSPFAGGSDANKAFRQTYVATYVQDDYKMRPRLTLNLGLRWEFITAPTEASGNRISNFHTQFVNGLTVLDTAPTLGSPFYASRKLGFAPRLGFAWDTFGNGKMAIRGGFGMFYDQVQSEFRNYTVSNVPFYKFLTVNNGPFPFGFSAGPGSALPTPNAIGTNLKVPTRLQYNLSIQDRKSVV